MTKRIVLTGGHAATAALAVVSELEKIRNPQSEISWIGTKKAVEGKNSTTLEHKIFSKHKIRDYYISSGRLQRKWTRYSVVSLFKIPLGFVMAFALLLKIKPDSVLSFGGFAAFPVVVSAWIFSLTWDRSSSSALF